MLLRDPDPPRPVLKISNIEGPPTRLASESTHACVAAALGDRESKISIKLVIPNDAKNNGISIWMFTHVSLQFARFSSAVRPLTLTACGRFCVYNGAGYALVLHSCKASRSFADC